jgi:transposase
MADSVSVDPLQRFRLILDTPEMRELSVAEQRYQAVTAVIGDRLSISQAAEKVGVSRQTLHAWLARYEAKGLEGLKATLMPLNLVITETHSPYEHSDHRRLRGAKWSRSLLAGLPTHRPAFWAAHRSSRWCRSSSHCCSDSLGASNSKTRLKPMLTSSAIRATLPSTPARV